MAAPPLLTAERQSAVAWFRYQGWLTVEIEDFSTSLAISPRTPATPHFIFDIGWKVTPVGGAWDLAAAVALADRLCTHCGGAFWRREERRSWAGQAATYSQGGKLRSLKATDIERRYGIWNKGTASSMIGFLQARQRLQAAGWWADASTPPAPPGWAPERLIAAILAEGLTIAQRFPDADDGPGPAPLPWAPTLAATTLAQLLDEDEQPAIVISDGAGASRALGEMQQPEVTCCDLAGVSGARRMLMALAAALVGGDPGLVGGSTMEVGSWLGRLLTSDGSTATTLVLDHCPRLPTDILHWLETYQKEGRRLIFVVRNQAEADRIQKQLRTPPQIITLPLLSRAEVEQQALPAILSALGLRCDRDELPWVADELWAWLHDGSRGVRWRDLGAVAAALGERGRMDNRVVDQTVIQRLRTVDRRVM